MMRLLYISQSAPGISTIEVQEIVQSARQNNPILGITGVLVHGGGMFMQLLEGSEQVLFRMYVKIMDDSRHNNCQVLHISPAKDRIFTKWSMGLIDSDPLEFQHINQLRARRLEAVQAKTFTDAMSEFVKLLTAQKQHSNL